NQHQQAFNCKDRAGNRRTDSQPVPWTAAHKLEDHKACDHQQRSTNEEAKHPSRRVDSVIWFLRHGTAVLFVQWTNDALKCHDQNVMRGCVHHTRQAFCATIGWPCLQPNAFWNSGMFCTTPLVRQRPGECGSTRTSIRDSSGVILVHHTRAKPRKKRWSGVYPSTFLSGSCLVSAIRSCNAASE